ncbi:MAG: MBL fold metallo-hydrolase [Candidatus Latescibacteria bacterium]|nr:MBL fold metallo-hydrolase [Candidatus Latescibacterota bacterium]
MSRVIRVVVGEIGTNCYLLHSQEEIAVIDPGFDGEKILSQVANLEGKITHIINTHGHIDHIGANQAIKDATGASIYIHKNDADMLRHPAKNLSLLMGNIVQSPKANMLLDEGDIIKVGQVSLKVIHTPGHTQGGICLISDKFAFTGDTLFFDSIGRTDFPGADEEQMYASLKKLKNILTDDMIIYPGHGEWGGFSEIKRINPFLKFSN